MATLTKSTGTVTLSGAVEKVTLPAVYGWVWVKNMSDADMFVGLSESVSAGADGVLAISAGECGRVQTDGFDSVYLMGTGNALVVAQNYADCPFKVGGKGGEMPDLSVYALKSKYGDTTINVGRKDGSDTGRYSTAEGYDTTASGYCSHAEGRDTIASSFCSHAGGYNTTALHNHEVAYGRYNISNGDTLFSIGDGTADDARHNAFEITTTGGKLHDKDIATTDDIPDLSAYAKKADVPNIKVNEAVNADTVGGKSADDFTQIINFGGSQTDTKNAVGQAGKTTIYRCENWTDIPNGLFDGQGTIIAINYMGAGIAGADGIWCMQTYISAHGAPIYTRFISSTKVSEWKEVYTSVNKPYVTGSATVEANSTTCITNHGFMPSAAMCWTYDFMAHVPLSYSENSLNFEKPFSENTSISYIIFK